MPTICRKIQVQTMGRGLTEHKPVETHVSWRICVGEKIKNINQKPINLTLLNNYYS